MESYKQKMNSIKLLHIRPVKQTEEQESPRRIAYSDWLQLYCQLIKLHRNEPITKQFILYQRHTLMAVLFILDTLLYNTPIEQLVSQASACTVGNFHSSMYGAKLFHHLC